MKAYPYDPRGTKTENHFLEERIRKQQRSGGDFRPSPVL